MPHKHKRRKTDRGSDFDLPPTTFARSLPAFQNDVKLSSRGKGQEQVKQKLRDDAQARQQIKEQKRSKMLKDDTPRAFKMLMMMQHQPRRLPSGLDDGSVLAGKKRKREQILSANIVDTNKASGTVAADYIPLETEGHRVPSIRPGERLQDFYARVDRSLPLSEISSKGKKVVVDGKEIKDSRETRHNKALKRKQENWRKEDDEYRARLEEEKERMEEEQEVRRELYGEEIISFEQRSHRRVRRPGEVRNDESDPWAILKQKREAPKGLHDVVQAPPKFDRIPKERFKIKEGAKVAVSNVPASAGSLRRREELAETRSNIIERYRQMMTKKRS